MATKKSSILNTALNTALDTKVEPKVEVKTLVVSVVRYDDTKVEDFDGYKDLYYTVKTFNEKLGFFVEKTHRCLVADEERMLGCYNGLKCELEFTRSEEKKIWAITKIKPLQKKVRNDDGSCDIVDIEQKGGNN